MKFRTNRLRDAIALSLTAGAATFAGAAFAQDADNAKTLDRIEVTGSNIPRTDTETASPVQVITRQEIDRSGKTTVAEYLQTLTVDGQGSIPKSFGNGFAGGGAGISLRGLGAGSTLVLLNGRRIAPFGLADDGQKVFTDLSTIPLDAVERVDVLKDGASAVYGSDAIAGVVNIILRKDFTGATARVSYGTSGDGDGDTRKGSLTAGFGDLATDGFNFFFTAEASKSDAIKMIDRKDRKWIGNGDIRPYGYDIYHSTAGVAGFRGLNGVAGNSPVGAIRNADNATYTYLEGCNQFTNVATPDPLGGCAWDVNKFRDISPKEEFANFFARGTFAISDNAELYTEFGYSKKKTVFNNTPSAVTGSWGFPGGPVTTTSGPTAMTIGADHPDNITGQTNRIRYSAWDVGPRVSNTDNEFMRFVAGVKGTAGAWDYDVGYLHSQSSITNQRTGFLINSRVRTVLNDPNSPVGYWRLGADAGLNSQALYDYISPTLQATGDTKLDIVDAKASRSLMDLRGGALGLAFGAEYRRQTVALSPTTFTDIGDVIGLGYSAYNGKEEVASAYAELNAPVLESLELNAAARFDSYKDGDNSFTPKFGIKWKPAEWIALRGTYAEGFRAPNPAEKTGQLAAFTTASDSVRCPDGVPYPGANPVPVCTGNVALITTGNTSLKPEESKTYSLGLVLDPTPSTSITIDAWQIKRDNEINTQSIDDAIAAGNAVRSDDDLVVNGVPVPNTGTLLAVLSKYINSSSTKVQGVDLDARQRFEMGNAGKLTLDLQWSHVTKFERTDGGSTVDFAGTHGNCDVTNCIGTPKDRINLGATWDFTDAFGISAVANYRSDFKNKFEAGDAQCASVFFEVDEGQPQAAAPNSDCRIPSFYTIDLSARWDPTENWQVYGSVANVTDRIAPLDPLTYGAVNYNPMDFSGAVGRYYTVGLKYTFK